MLTSLTFLLILCWMTAHVDVIIADEPLPPAEVEFFESRIRPVLVKHCYECHSALADSVQGNLRLDSQPGWMRGGDSGPAIAPGKPEESLLIESLKYESLEMPPAGRLPGHVIADFERWIRNGAVDPRTDEPALQTRESTVTRLDPDDWWVLQPLRRPAVPAVQTADWCRTPIDRFVLAKLESAGITPNPDAATEVLLRRLSFDLTGLPPTAEQVTSAATAGWDDLQRTIIPQLLDAPDFGIHWGRHWLDVVRYADSNGSDFNATFRSGWRYRDYVVDSFNQDRSFAEFVQEQIAGDLMLSQTDQQRHDRIVATGFLMVGAKMLSERDKDKLKLDIVDEQIDTIGRVFLGMTLGCARCHDHKFDPVNARDYYALAGILGSTVTIEGESQQYVSTWVETPLPVPESWRAAREEFESTRDALKKELKLVEQSITRLKKQQELSTSIDGAILVDDVDAEKEGTWASSQLSPNFVGSSYLHDGNQAKGEQRITYRPRFENSGEYEVRVSYTPGKGRATRVPIEIQAADQTHRVTLNQEPAPEISGLYQSIGTFRFEKDAAAWVRISNAGTSGFVIADAVLFVPVTPSASPAETVASTDAKPPSDPVAEQLREVTANKQMLDARLKQLEDNAPPEIPTAMAAREAPEIADCHLRIRGEVHRHGELIPRGFIECVPGTPTGLANPAQSGRLELARWLVDRRNPVTARVIANRVWQHLIGEGLVRSVDNFGQLGERPTHPELLDWLACELIEHDWSIKHLVRLIVASRVYGVSSDSTPDTTDPDNRLLGRAFRRRLTAESIRDAMLAAGQRLNQQMGGSMVSGYAYLAVSPVGERGGNVDLQSFERRSLYLPLVRNLLPTMLTVFDYPDPDLVSGRRATTTVPAQALFLMNSEFVQRSAGELAGKLLREQPYDLTARVVSAWQTTLSRAPTDSEVRLALQFNDELLDEGRSELEALTLLVHTLLASTEFRMCN